MEISNQTNNNQAVNAYQKPPVTTLPVEDPIEPPQEELSPEEQLKQDREAQATQDGADAEAQAKQDAQRGYAAGYISHQSKQTQIEIYLSVANDAEVSLGNDTPSVIESLRDVQKQNNAVEAYATYQENQKGEQPALY